MSQGRDCDLIPKCHLKRFAPAAAAAPVASADAAVEETDEATPALTFDEPVMDPPNAPAPAVPTPPEATAEEPAW